MVRPDKNLDHTRVPGFENGCAEHSQWHERHPLHPPHQPDPLPISRLILENDVLPTQGQINPGDSSQDADQGQH